MKKFLCLLSGCFIISSQLVSAQPVHANQLILPAKTFTIPFQWQGDSINSTWEANVAMLIPVRLKNIHRIFYMQFDLGSPYSLLYKNKIDAIKTRHPGSFHRDGVRNGKMKDFSFKAGHSLISAREIIVKQFDSSTIEWRNKNKVEIIGTIGADLIDGKVSIIDYPHRTLTISDSIPGKLVPHISLTDFIYAGRRVLFPANIQNKKTLLYFDTGSSMFALLTNKETCHQLAVPNAKLMQSKVESWGRQLTANTLASHASIDLANTSIPIQASTYMEGVNESQVDQMSRMGIGGMTGNKLFLNYILVLDTKNKKFGLVRLPG